MGWYVLQEWPTGINIRQARSGRTFIISAQFLSQKHHILHARFEVLTAVLMKIKVFWDVM
jgi:hypothetical protein